MTVLILKKNVYMALEPQRNEEVGKGMELVEGRLNVMQAVLLAIQTSPSLGAGILVKGQHLFHLLFNKYFTETLEVTVWVKVTQLYVYSCSLQHIR